MPYSQRALLLILLLALSLPALAEPDLDVTMEVVEGDTEQSSVTHAIELPRQEAEEQRSQREGFRKERDKARREAREDQPERRQSEPKQRQELQGGPKGGEELP